MWPDGRKVVYGSDNHGKPQLWLRSLDAERAQALPGTGGATAPFWSPDSRSIGFFADQKLKRLDLNGPSARPLADSTSNRGGAWGDDGSILFVPANTSPVFRVPAAGGQAVKAVSLGPEQASHRFPRFLPDGRHFVFYVSGTPSVQGVWLGSLDSQDTRRLFDSDSGAVFAPPDFLLFARAEALLAQRLDLGTLAAVGEPFLVADSVATVQTYAGSVALSSSRAGILAYRPGAAAARQLIWLDRTAPASSTCS